MISVFIIGAGIMATRAGVKLSCAQTSFIGGILMVIGVAML